MNTNLSELSFSKDQLYAYNNIPYIFTRKFIET